MFTGIIEELGIIKSIRPMGIGLRITVEAKLIMDDLKIDDSVSINGVCQTVVAKSKTTFEVEAVEETIRKTKFSKIHAGQKVNLERALTPSTRMGGHIVQGHVDSLGKITSIHREGAGVLVWVSFDEKFQNNTVNTGSICIDGVSLTTAKVEKGKFLVSVIPHTWQKTSLSQLAQGDDVNLEFDILGKYVENILSKQPKKSGLDKYISQPDFF